MSGQTDKCIMWHEGISGRRATDILSSFYKIILLDSEKYSNFLFWLDNCAAQNKNWVLFTNLISIVNSTPNIEKITLKYLENGHTYMRADAIHGNIGKILKKTEADLDFSELQNVKNK